MLAPSGTVHTVRHGWGATRRTLGAGKKPRGRRPLCFSSKTNAMSFPHPFGERDCERAGQPGGSMRSRRSRRALLREAAVSGASLLGLALLAGCVQLPSAAPPIRVWRLGLFHVGIDHVPPSLEPLRDELKTLGYAEGKNLSLDWRNLPDEATARVTAQDFVRDRVDLIVAFEDQTVRATRAATSDIPVVFLHVQDPVADGYVPSLAHPGGNLTGFVGGSGPFPDKQIELFTEVLPSLRRLLVLTDPLDPVSRRIIVDTRRAAATLNLDVVERSATDQGDLEEVFGSLQAGEVDGVFVASQILQTDFSTVILRLAAERRVPLALHRRQWVEQGALFSYGPDLAPVGRSAARTIVRILQGTRPADIPVEQILQYELIINLKTARELGLVVPDSIVRRADAVIQ